MPLDVAAIIRLAETGLMPEEEEIEEPITPSVSIIESENVARKTISAALREPEEPEEFPMPKIYKDLARVVRLKGDVDLEYSPKSIAQQLKRETYPSKEVATSIDAVLGAYATFGVALTKIPRAVAASVLQALQGKEGAIDEDWTDRYIEDTSTDIQKFAKEAYMRFGDKGFAGIKITDLAELPQNVGYSVTSMLGGLAVGLPLAAVPLPGFRVAAWGAGTIVSGAIAYRATTYQIMQRYLDIKEKESEIYNGRKLTKEERLRLYEGFDKLAHQYGLWEAVPEALSNLAFGKLLLTPLTKMVGKTIAGQIITRLGALYGEELLTETITQMGQAGVEVRAGLRPGAAPDWDSPTDWINSFKEVAPQTFLLTTLMAGAGTAIISTSKAIKDIRRSLKKEIGKTHVHYEGFLRKLSEAEKAEIGPQYGEVPPPVTDKKTILKTTEDVSAMARLDKEERILDIKAEEPKARIHTFQEFKDNVRDSFGIVVGENPNSKITLYSPTPAPEIIVGTKGKSEAQKIGEALHEMGHLTTMDEGTYFPELMERDKFLATELDAYKWAIDNSSKFGINPKIVMDIMPKSFKAKYSKEVRQYLQIEPTALMIPEYPAKIVTVGKKPGVMRTRAQAKKVIHNEKVNVLIGSMEKGGKVPAYVKKKVIEEQGFLRKLGRGKQIYWAGNRIIENVAGILDRARPYGANWVIITGDINEAENTKLDGIYSRREGLQTFMAQTYGEKDMTRPLIKERKIGEFSLSDANIMAIYKGSFDPQVVKHLKQGNGFTDKDIAQCVAIVEADPKMQATVDFITKRYEEDHPLLAKVHMEQTGEVLPKRPFYMHLPVDFKQPVFERDNVVQQMMKRDKMGTHAYVTSNIIKERVPSKRPIHLDYIANYMKYISEAEHYKAYIGPIKNLTSLLSDQRYRGAVQRNINNAAMETLDKYVKDVAGTSSRELKTMDHVMSAIRQHTGLVLIGGNILSGFRQTLSYFNAMAEVGPYWMFRGTEMVMRDHKGMEKLIFSKSEQIEHRAGMWERFIAEMRREEKAADILTGRMTPRKLFMAFSSWFDKNTVLCAAVATYMRTISTGKLIDSKERIPNTDLERFAVLEMERVSRKTQPHVGAKDLPGWHRGSTVALMFTLFQNMANKVVNYVDYDIVYKTRVGAITPGRAAQKFLFAVILPALMLGMIARGRFPSIKEALLDVARFPVHGMFLVGSFVNTVIEDYGDWQSPLFIGPQAGAKALKAMTRGEWSKAGKYGIQTTAYALGVPYNQPYRTYKGLRALMNDETDDWRRLIWSDYALTKGK